MLKKKIVVMIRTSSKSIETKFFENETHFWQGSYHLAIDDLVQPRHRHRHRGSFTGWLYN